MSDLDTMNCLPCGLHTPNRTAYYDGKRCLHPGTEACRRMAERLRERAQAFPPRWMERELKLTLSIGVAQWRGASDDASAVLARADEALYRAKASGRNRVEADRANHG